jgi:hypothetical protein
MELARPIRGSAGKAQLGEAFKAVRTGTNTKLLTALPLGSNPLNGMLPDSPSWWYKKPRNDRPRFQRDGRSRPPRKQRDRFQDRAPRFNRK